MQIVVTHLTRMSAGHICVAGVEDSTGREIRPVAGHLSTSMLARNGGPFDIGNRVELGAVTAVPTPPEVEDHQFDPAQARQAGTLRPGELWALVAARAKRRFPDVFGCDPRLHRSTMGYIESSEGRASLGYLIPSGRPSLVLNTFGKIRLALTDGTFHLDMPVTDIRLYGRDHVTPDSAVIAAVSQRLARATCVIAVGLGRPFPGALDHAVHWMQANNVHFKDNPLWQLG